MNVDIVFNVSVYVFVSTNQKMALGVCLVVLTTISWVVSILAEFVCVSLAH